MHLRNILLAIGVLALVAGAMLTVLWFTQQPPNVAATKAPPSAGASAQTEAGTPRDTVKNILTAAHAIPSGTFLRAEDLAWKDVPPAEVQPDNILRDKAQDNNYLGALTHRDFAAGEPLAASQVLKPTDRGFLAALLSPGSRAVSIAVEATQSASGLIMPGNRVDIILTQTFGEDGDPARKSVGETVLRNLRVIAVDRRLGAELPTAGAKTAPAASDIPKTITLEVTERQAEMLMVASRLGRVEVIVRALGQPQIVPSEKQASVSAMWASDVSPALKDLKRAPVAMAAPAVAAPAVSAPAAPAKPARLPIEVMHGSKIEAR